MPPKLYCGNKEELPKGYTRNGTRFECLKKGYGAALVYSTQEQRNDAIQKVAKKIPRLSKAQLQNVALQLNAKILHENNTPMSKIEIIESIIEKLETSFL